MMGTVIRVTIAGATKEQAGPAIDAAFAEIKRLEQLLSEWIPTSDISRINAAAGDSAVHVSGETIDVIEAPTRSRSGAPARSTCRGRRCAACTCSSLVKRPCRS
jgi:thiamine biosynthesis lipoprotein ApbE